MSTKVFNSALDFLPESRPARGGNFLSLIGKVLSALSEARQAEAAYNREIGRGVTPSKAAANAFSETFKSH